MPLHLAELRKHTEQNEKIIALLTEIRGNQNVIPSQPQPANTRKPIKNSNKQQRGPKKP